MQLILWVLCIVVINLQNLGYLIVGILNRMMFLLRKIFRFVFDQNFYYNNFDPMRLNPMKKGNSCSLFGQRLLLKVLRCECVFKINFLI